MSANREESAARSLAGVNRIDSEAGLQSGEMDEAVSAYQEFSDYTQEGRESDGEADYDMTEFDQSYIPQKREEAQCEKKVTPRSPLVGGFVSFCASWLLPVTLLVLVALQRSMVVTPYFAAFVAMCLAPSSSSLFRTQSSRSLTALCLRGTIVPNFPVVVFLVLFSTIHLGVEVVCQILCINGVSPPILLWRSLGHEGICSSVRLNNLGVVGLVLVGSLCALLNPGGSQVAHWTSAASPSGVIAVLMQIFSPTAVMMPFVAATSQSLNGLVEVPLVISVIVISVLSMQNPPIGKKLANHHFVLRSLQLHLTVLSTMIIIFDLIAAQDAVLKKRKHASVSVFITGIDLGFNAQPSLVAHLTSLFCSSVMIRVNNSDAASVQWGKTCSALRDKFFFPWVRKVHTAVNLVVGLAVILLVPSGFGLLWAFFWLALATLGRCRILNVCMLVLGLANWVAIFAFGFSSVQKLLPRIVLEDIGVSSASSSISPTGLAVIVFGLSLWNLLGLRLVLQDEASPKDLNGTHEILLTFSTDTELEISNRDTAWVTRLAAVFANMNTLSDRLLATALNLKPYFILPVFISLFVAAVIRVNVLHCGFLLLFSVVVVWQRCPPFLWTIVVGYTVVLTSAIYAFWAFGPTSNRSLAVIGFIDETTSVWHLLPYFLLSYVFICHWRLGTSVQSAFSEMWQMFVSGLENVGVMLVVIATIVLFAAVFAYEQASLIGEVYLITFLFASSTCFYGSFECPPRWVVWIWTYILQPVVGLQVAAVYVVSLLGESTANSMDSTLVAYGLSSSSIGLTKGGSLWPKLALVMLLIVVTRSWRSRLRTRDIGQSDGIPGDGASAQRQGRRVLQALGVVSAVTAKLQRLIAIYSQALCVVVLYLGSMIIFTELYTSPSAAQAVYFILALFASIFTRARHSAYFWRTCQIFSGVWAVVVFTLQQPAYVWQPTSLHVYFGLYSQNPNITMWPYVGIHIMVFAVTALHANLGDGESERIQLRTETRSSVELVEPERASQASTAGSEGFSDSIKRTNIADILASALQLGVATVTWLKLVDQKLQQPLSYFRRIGYYATLLCLIITARVLNNCVLGPLFLLSAAIYGLMGKYRAISGYRWFFLSVFTFKVVTVLYFLRLGYPPDSGHVDGVLKRSLSQAVRQYLVIEPSEIQMWLVLLCWCAVSLERRAIRTYRGSRPLVGIPHVTGLTVADRLIRYSREIKKARENSDRDLLSQCIPLPKEATRGDLTKSQRLSDKMRVFMFKYFGIMLLVVAFIHAVYDTSTSIDLLKLVSQVAVMGFFQNFHGLPWSGYRYWKWYFRFHVAWMLCRMLIFVPGIEYNSSAVCAMKICGLLPVDHQMPTYVSLPPGTTCPGNRWSSSELAFHTVCLTLTWWQVSLFSKRDYGFVLHRLFEDEASSTKLGETIRFFRLRAIQLSKVNTQGRERERLAALREMIVSKGALDQGPVVSDAVDEVKASSSWHDSDFVVLPTAEASPTTHRRTYFDSLSAEHERISRGIERLGQVNGSFASPAVDSRSLAVLAGVHADSPSRAHSTRAVNKQQKRAAGKGFRAAWRRLWQFGREYIDEIIMWLDRNSLGLGANPITKEGLRNDGRFFPLLKTSYRFLLSYTDRLAFLTFCVHFAVAPSLMTAVLPVSVFSYAAVVNPRPHRRYWQLALAYIELVIIIKTVIVATECSEFAATAKRTDRANSAFIASPLHGRTCVAECYLVDMLLSLVCLIFVVIHVAQLRAWGLYNDVELYVDHDKPSTIVSEVGYGVRDTFKNIGRNEVKVGGEYYNAAFAVELVSFFFIFFAYYKLVGSSDSLVASLQNSILPGNLAIILIVLIAIIIVDRILYLLRSSYGKYAFSVLLALGYHIIMVWWFVEQTEFVGTYYRNNSFDVRGTLYLAGALYLLKGLYLYLGSAQLHHGWYETVRHICFTGNYGSIESTLYTISRLTPFVYDLRVVLDWTVTPSALKLNYWIKLEDIAHEVYLVLVDRQDTRDVEKLKKTPSSPYPKIFKYSIGVTFFCTLVAILVLPLLLYSSFSPVLESNSIESVRSTLSIDGVPTLWSSSNLKLGSGGSLALNRTIVNLLQRQRPELVGYDLARNVPQIFLMSNYSDSLWSITPPAISLLLQQLDSHDKLMTISFTTEVKSSAKSLANPTLSVAQRYTLSREARGNISSMLRRQSGSVLLPQLYVPFLYNEAGRQLSTFGGGGVDGSNTQSCRLHLNSGGVEGYYFGLSCQTLFSKSTPQSETWNALGAKEWLCLLQDSCEDVQSVSSRANYSYGSSFVLATSTLVLNAGILQSIGIVAAYTTFVLAIGRVIRYALSGSAYRTTLEDMEDPAYLVCIIEFMMTIRGRKQYVLEQQLYQELVNTIRDSTKLEQRTRYKSE